MVPFIVICSGSSLKSIRISAKTIWYAPLQYDMKTSAKPIKVFVRKQVINRLNTMKAAGDVKKRKIESTYCVEDKQIQKLLLYSAKGFQFSQQPLFEACCSECSVLMYKTVTSSRKCNKIEVEDGDPIPIETLYRQDFLDGVRYFCDDQKHFRYICTACHSGKKSGIEVFPLIKREPGKYLLPIPDVSKTQLLHNVIMLLVCYATELS
jgi:hypothetical protein